MSCKCVCRNSCPCSNQLGGLSCTSVTPLLLLILIALQFGKCKNHDHHDPCHDNSECGIDNSILFIIALFLLLSCGCGCTGNSNHGGSNGCCFCC